MVRIQADDGQAVAIAHAIQSGNVDLVRQMLHDSPELATTKIVDNRGVGRTLLHIAADWPGHFPNGAEVVRLLAAAGADLNAAVENAGFHRETPLHWAASSDDVQVVDALLDAGADIEAPGAVFTGGPAMSDAVVFAQWRAARRLLERGAKTTTWQAAALGLMDRVRDDCSANPTPSPRDVTNALWHACRGGQKEVAEYLIERGGDVTWVGRDNKTPLDVARESGNDELVGWLEAVEARR